MRNPGHIPIGVLALWLSLGLNVSAAERFVSPGGGHVAPFTSWADAATNIQAAIDAAATGDTVTVTNGLYDSGGKVMAGDLTNRVALDKPLLVRSVNGPGVTIIQGAWDFVATNGPGAVRCAWLTNGAMLSGFTLRGGATRSSSGSPPTSTTSTNSGGGAWSASLNSVVTNCIITGNSASARGGGVFSNTVVNSIITANIALTGASSPQGGGAYASILRNCAVTSNRIVTASLSAGGGGAYNGTLTNCSVIGNFAPTGGGLVGSALDTEPVMNCIVVSNSASLSGTTNYSGTFIFRYSCTIPLPSGTGNIAADPQLIPDKYHIAYTSPCRGAGNALLATGTDIDGQPWSSPPSMGCDENNGAPIFVSQPRLLPGPSGQLQLNNASVTGLNPVTYVWLKDGNEITGSRFGGLQTPQLLINGFGPDDAGAYLLVASNSVGVATSQVVQVVVRCVSVAGLAPAAPFTNWFTAATNIQTAIDAANPGDIVLVTNGVYNTGSKVMAGGLTNRVTIDKAAVVMSVNGATSTLIEGMTSSAGTWAFSPPNGTNAIRCAWLADGAILSGFTLQGGGTRISSATTGFTTNSGGGVWCASSNALVSFCTVWRNSGYYYGGGAFGGTLNNCTIEANAAGQQTAFDFHSSSQGGGAYNCTLNNCLVRGNQSGGTGGGVYGGVLNNCSVINNYCNLSSGTGGAENALLRNCITWNNTVTGFARNHGSSTLFYSCSGNPVSGAGNITNNPLFLSDGIHLSSASPCCRTGSSNYTSGVDMDGQAWTNPPSMGCDDWQPQPLLLGFKVQANHWNQFDFNTLVAGIESSPGYWFKDGLLISNNSHYAGAGTPHLTVKGVSSSDTGNYQLILSNAFGMTTSRVAGVTIHFVNATNGGASSPYTSWATAAGTIQEAIDAAAADAVILVTNGLYNIGGRTGYIGGVTNRILVDKPIGVVSVNGPFQSIIEGRWDSVSTNGVNAIRCVLLLTNSSLAGFTLCNGASETNGTGGGVATSDYALISSCVISNNQAFIGGGGDLGTYNNCWFIRNRANTAGGATRSGTLINCTLVENSAVQFAGGISGGTLTNCIVWHNTAPSSPNTSATAIFNSCSPSIGIDSGNITNDPQLMDGLHIAENSPCRGMGVTTIFNTSDLDDEVWLSPPSMGADEFPAAGLFGPLAAFIETAQTNVIVNHSLTLIGRISGMASRVEWSYGDGPVVTNTGYFTTHAWTNPGDYTVTFTAFNSDNPGGVSTNLIIHVEPLLAPTLLPVGFISATNFQFQFGGQSGAAYTVEYATNLSPPVTWRTLSSLSSTGGVMQITDAKATNAARFYRVKAQ